jgi:hypothetical protein
MGLCVLRQNGIFRHEKTAPIALFHAKIYLKNAAQTLK